MLNHVSVFKAYSHLHAAPVGKAVLCLVLAPSPPTSCLLLPQGAHSLTDPFSPVVYTSSLGVPSQHLNRVQSPEIPSARYVPNSHVLECS